jgi:putative transposase
MWACSTRRAWPLALLAARAVLVRVTRKDRERDPWFSTHVRSTAGTLRARTDCVEKRFGAIRVPQSSGCPPTDRSSPPPGDRDRASAEPRTLIHPGRKLPDQWYGRSLRLQARHVRVSLIPNAAALALVDSWMEHYNTVHPHSRLGNCSPREYMLAQPIACPAYRGQLHPPSCMRLCTVRFAKTSKVLHLDR